MSNIIVATRNHLVAYPGVSINSPIPSEDVDFRLTNILDRGRERFWKCGSAAPATFDVDLDLEVETTYRVAALLRNRQHNGGSGITNVEVFTATGATYPPGAWTSRGSFAVTTAINNKGLDFGSAITARQMRFRITASGRYSCRLYVARAADYLALGTEGANIGEEPLRSRAAERVTMMGSRVYGETGVGFSRTRRRFRFTHALTSSSNKAQWTQSQSEGLLLLHSDGSWEECVHVQPDFSTERAPGAAALDSHSLYFESLP